MTVSLSTAPQRPKLKLIGSAFGVALSMHS
jgi:hypothetical protein